MEVVHEKQLNPNKMKKYKPDLNEKLTIRVSVATRDALRALCQRNDLDEALIARIALEAGMALAGEHGITQLMDARDKTIKPAAAAAEKKEQSAGKSTPWTIRKGEGAAWELSDPHGKIVKRGPLYAVRPHAKKVAPAGSVVEILRVDGTVERLA